MEPALVAVMLTEAWVMGLAGVGWGFEAGCVVVAGAVEEELHPRRDETARVAAP